MGTADLLEARLGDAIERCERGIPTHLSFLTPRDRVRAERLLRACGAWDRAFFWGGYATAERACLFLLPDYLTACLSALPIECDPDEVLALLGEECTDAVSAVWIGGSGYHALSHRDFLGAILGLGLERDALGDVAVQSEHAAVLFCPRALVPFLEENLSKVGADTVRVRPYTPDGNFTDGRHYRAISDTVASERLDCVIASLCNLSRDAAQALIRSGAVEVDFEPAERVDLLLSPPATISARGYGRFILRAFDGETRKGRLRLRADQLV
ncbi:MAG: hypothetical protein IJW29_07590 [Clostridia bacterium]|nr:hypothetical protein [Clostridia bacterium]